MKNLFPLVLAMSCGLALASEPMLVHQHYVKWVGVLPQPYNTLEVEVELDSETDDPKYFNMKVGGIPVHFKEEDLAKLKNLELGTMELVHEIHRDPDRPSVPPDDYMKDWIIMRMELGPVYRIEWEKDGKTQYQWGRDYVDIVVTEGKDSSISISKQAPMW